MLIIRTNNPLKQKAIRQVSNMSNDKIKEFVDIIEILNADEIKAKDIRNIKFIVGGGLEQSTRKTPKRIILKIHKRDSEDN